MIRNFLFRLFSKLIEFYEDERRRRLVVKYELKDVSLGKGHLEGIIKIGRYTYINNNFRIVSGENSKINIGSNCAIGRNFNCSARTHDFERPTPIDLINRHKRIESDIRIGDHVWIGDNVIVKPGIIIDDYSIIGANSVVTKNVKKFEIVGGVPAKHIRFNTEHEAFKR